MNKTGLKRPLAFGFTTLVFVSMLYLSDFESSIEALGQARHHLLAAGFVLANAPVLIYAKVWKNMLHISDIRLSYSSSLKVVLANTFVNNLTPFGNIGGEVAATLYLSELTGKKKSEIFSAAFSASIINFTPLIILGLTGGILLGYISLAQILTGLSIILLASLWSIYAPDMGFSNPLPLKIKSFLSETANGLSKLRDRKKEVVFLLFLTHAAALSSIASVHVIGLSLGYNLSIPLLVLAMPLARIGNYAPTPGGSVAYEAALTGILTYLFPVSLQSAALITAIYRAITYYTGIITGYIGVSMLEFEGENLFNEDKGQT